MMANSTNRNSGAKCRSYDKLTGELKVKGPENFTTRFGNTGLQVSAATVVRRGDQLLLLICRLCQVRCAGSFLVERQPPFADNS